MSVRVVARVRPLLGDELETEIIVRTESSQPGQAHNVVRIPNPKKEKEDFRFSFNAVYDSNVTQEQLFTNEVSPHLRSLFRGLDLTIFAYGVTGTGKTHTMRGGMKLADRGVIPRLLSAIYRRGRKVTKDSNGETTIEVSLAYYEIYNDKVYDLFEPLEKRNLSGLPLREKEGKTVVVGLSEHACNDLKEFERLYIQANNNRSTAGTKLNSQSSRSHAILQVKVSQTTGSGKLVSTASAIDLAGSEDNRRTENNKERMVESASINKSLFVLSSCIDAIGRGDKRIPYRESRMTRILSLGQNQGITIMILNLAPLRSYHLDTLSSLNVSSRAKRIEVREIENEIVFTCSAGKAASATSLSAKRQPLRPLANAHNTHPSSNILKGNKPTKSFSVYTDRIGTAARPAGKISQTISKPNSLPKRNRGSSLNSRPAKIIKLNPVEGNLNAGLSSDVIERIVEQKVREALESRELKSTTAIAPSGISESLQRRLEALERKIENEEIEESRAEGLRILLMAKQYRERGEDSCALKMYEQAIPFFPGQEKLQKKIEDLREKIQMAEKETINVTSDLNPSKLATEPPISCQAQHDVVPRLSPVASWKNPLERSSRKESDNYRGDIFNNFALQAGQESHESMCQQQPRAKRSSKAKNTTAKSSFTSLSDDADPLALPTPRTRHLLDIINSRDITMIKGLQGVGAKKARDMVEFLELQSEDQGGNIRTLHELIAVPGLGKRSVERAYEGITALLL